MPAQVQQSALMKRYGPGLDKAVKAHAKDETKLGFLQLPGGIKNGIAQVVECGFAQVDQGKPNGGEFYFRAAAVVISPEFVMDKGVNVKVKGRQTSVMEMLCQTKNSKNEVVTQEEHISNVLNEMRKMGADTTNATGADLETIAAALKEAGPFITFSTSETAGGGMNPKTKKPYEPRVFENWNGVAEGYDGPSAEGGMADSSPAADEQSGDDANANADGIGAAADSDVGGEDWDSLVARYGELDEGHERDEVTEKLVQLAVDAGVDKEAAEAAENWDIVVEMMQAAGEAGPEVAAAEEPFEPVKGGVYGWETEVLKDPKNPKKGKVKKKLDVEVLTIDKKASTVTVKDNTTKKPVLGPDGKKALAIAWDALIVS